MVVLSSFLLVFLVTSFGDVFPLRLSDGDAELSGHTSGMLKRSDFIGKSAYLGMMAIKKVLVGAKKLPSRKKCCQYYVKTGTFREAVRDFDMMNPDIDSIAKYEVEGIYSQAGVVGDKDILIRSSNMDGKPYLVISDRKPSYTGPQKAMTAKRIMITYRGKLGRLRDSER